MTQILGIKLSDHGPVCYFASGSLVVEQGQTVLVDTDQGVALGRVVTIHAPEAGPDGAPLRPSSATPAAPTPTTKTPAPFAESFEDGFGEAHWAPFSATAQEQAQATAEPAPVVEAAPLAENVPPTENGPSTESPAPADTSVDTSAEAAASKPPAATSNQPPPAVVDLSLPQQRPRHAEGLARILRLAVADDLEIAAENRKLARKAHAFCRGCINEQRLDMKLVDVEMLQDRGKMIFYFTAPGRIDFRELIKSLVREFHTRIELRQIGVRHETQMLGAIGNCGQVCCCRRFLRKFAPVTIKMAKEQNLFLNPAKISGICGRLLCCLSYEQKGYEEFHKQCPKMGKRFQTALGSVKVLRGNFFKKSISVWMEEGGEREFTLDEWRELLNRQPGDAPPPDAQPAPRAAGERNGRSEGGRSESGRQRNERPRNERPRPDKPRSERAREERHRDEKLAAEAREQADAVRAPREDGAEGKTESRPESRTENRPEARNEGRAEGRPEGRGEGRPERRPERRPESRSERRPETRQENRPDAREPRAETPAAGHSAVGASATMAGEAEGEGRERQRPRRKRRRPKGPKPPAS